MTNWQTVIDADFTWPAGQSRADLIAELSEDLRSPDPVRRDDHAFTVLARWMPELDSGQRRSLGDLMAARLADPRIQARTFAALALACVIEQGDFDPGWLAAFSAWYLTETDLRGYDPELGWLHAVAHGADLLRMLGRHPEVDPVLLLELAAARLLAPTSYVFAELEDDRLGFAVAQVLTRKELSPAQSVDWLEPIRAEFTAAEPGPVPPQSSNTIRTLRVLYLLADRGVRPNWSSGDPVPLAHRDALRQEIADVLALVLPYPG